MKYGQYGLPLRKMPRLLLERVIPLWRTSVRIYVWISRNSLSYTRRIQVRSVSYYCPQWYTGKVHPTLRLFKWDKITHANESRVGHVSRQTNYCEKNRLYYVLIIEKFIVQTSQWNIFLSPLLHNRYSIQSRIKCGQKIFFSFRNHKLFVKISRDPNRKPLHSGHVIESKIKRVYSDFTSSCYRNTNRE